MISITLPSIYPEALCRALANIAATTFHNYEVIVVADFEEPSWASRPELVWVRSPREGCAAAHTRAATVARGEFITAFSDDFLYVDGWDIEALANFRCREKQKPFCLGLRYGKSSYVGTVFGIYYANFPFVRHATVEDLGYIEGPYKRGFGDSDFSLRVWNDGGRCEFSDKGLLIVHEDDNRKNGEVTVPEDTALFLSRWKSRYGKNFDLSHLRGFNLDVRPEEIPDLVEGNTIFFNDREFARRTSKQVPPYLIETRSQINLVGYRDEIYLIPQWLGPVDLAVEEERLGALRRGARKFATIGEARKAIP